MSHAPSLSAVPSESTELVAAEADYEALTDALMQTRRGRWFLTEHARRCREAENADLRQALARIEQTLAAPREPAALAEIQEKLGALPRIEQALADYRDPPAIAELRESLGALARIEQTLAAPREPAALARIQEKLDALPRIEQAVAEQPREASGVAELREQVAAFAQTLEGVRAEVVAQRPPEPDPAEQARDREREEAMLRLLHEQRERLDALADIWARVQAAPAAPAPQMPAANEPEPEPAPAPASVVAPAGLAADEPGEPPPIEPLPAMAMPGTGEPAAAVDERPGDAAGADAMPFDLQTPTADLLGETAIFGAGAATASPPEDPPAPPLASADDQPIRPLASADDQSTRPLAPTQEDGTAPAWTFDAAVAALDDEPAPAAGPDPIMPASAEPPAPQAEPFAPAAGEGPAPAIHADPIVQMFIDPEPAGALAAPEPHGSEPAVAPAAWPLPERGQFPAWLVGAAASAPQSIGAGEIDASASNTEAATGAAGLEAALADDVLEDVACKAETAPLTAVDADETVSAEDDRASPTAADNPRDAQPPDLAELTLDLLQKALFSQTAHNAEPSPAADPAASLPDDARAPAPEVGLLAAIALLRRALDREEGPSLDGTVSAEIVALDTMPVRPPQPAALRAPEPATPAPADPLAPVYALSEEERIALFS